MIYVNGLYRSGSTVIYNIVKHLISEGLVKDSITKQHEHWVTRPLQRNDLNIYSYRDVRTSAASFMRKRGWTENSFLHPSVRSGKVKDYMLLLVEVDMKTRERFHREHLRNLILKYEIDILDIEQAIRKILASLNILLPEDVIQILIECHNIHAVKNYVDTLKDKEDKRTMFHPNHVSLEKTDFKHYLSNDSWNDPVILEWLKEKGYEC